MYRYSQICLLSITLAGLGASQLTAQSNVGVAFNNSGLSSLTYQGREYLAYGDLRLTEVDFVNSSGGVSKGDTNGSVVVNAAQATQTRTYPWGSITIAYSAT